MADRTWPSIEDVIRGWDLPQDLQQIVADRYERHGTEYASENVFKDSKPVNLCMAKDNIEDAIEEIVDALFNMMVHTFRALDDNPFPHPQAIDWRKSTYVTHSLIALYQACREMQTAS